MALILSIPQHVRASQIDATQRIHKLYDGYYYDFVPDDSIPEGYEFNSDVLDYVISQGGNALNAWMTQRYGKVINFVFNSVYQNVFSLMRTGYMAVLGLTAALVNEEQYVYKWSYECTGIEETNTQYGTKYGFLFTGLLDETFSIVLNQNGNIWGSEPIGNITFSSTQEEVINQYMPDLYDPNNIVVPVSQYRTFSNLKAPYLDGKTLHLFPYLYGYESHMVVQDFTRCVISFWVENNKVTYIIVFNIDGNQPTVYFDNNLANLQTVHVEYTGAHGPYSGNGYAIVFNGGNGYPQSEISFNYPTYLTVYNYQINGFRIGGNNVLGMLNGNIYQGFGDIWLDKISTTPTGTPANPAPVPIDTPIPVTEIPSNPEDPIPLTPNPDPVPGIPVNPVNPTPPPLRPVPSIVSGNDDLWPSVVELQNIEIDLSAYLSGLGDYTFPDLSTITESFAGSIVWVSALMSTLFNGSDFSILFAVLSSFFIVAALLGLYKWWNHK